MSTQTTLKHTPGTWTVMPSMDADGNKGVYVMGISGDICDLYTYRKDEHGVPRELVPFKNAEANARLIAAAPEMLEACLSALARFEVEQSFGPHRQQLYAAIFSATGVPVDNQSDDMEQNTSSGE